MDAKDADRIAQPLPRGRVKSRLASRRPQPAPPDLTQHRTPSAGKQTGRRAVLMMIDPLYCDVIVRRWERFTGKEVKRTTN
jgi:hypothetical protein